MSLLQRWPLWKAEMAQECIPNEMKGAPDCPPYIALPIWWPWLEPQVWANPFPPCYWQMNLNSNADCPVWSCPMIATSTTMHWTS
jgi:hypothetical protein